MDQIDFSIFQSQSKMEQEPSQEIKDMETLLKTFATEEENQQDQNFSQDNNVDQLKKIKQRSTYSKTKVKARNLLTNVSYKRFKTSDFNKTNFVVDILSFLVQNCNPANLEIKLETEKEREMVKFLWDTCVPRKFTIFLLKQENFNIISQTNLTYQKANKIVSNYVLNATQEEIAQLKYKIVDKINMIHFIYSILYAKIYNRTNSFGITNKNDFDFQFQVWKKEKIHKMQLAKDVTNYANREVREEEQKPIQITAGKNQQKKRMLEEKLEENNRAMKRIKKVIQCKINRLNDCK